MGCGSVGFGWSGFGLAGLVKFGFDWSGKARSKSVGCG